jgi:hypothetical protein
MCCFILSHHHFSFQFFCVDGVSVRVGENRTRVDCPVSDMALIRLCGFGSPSSSLLCLFAMATFVLVCSCSYSSSSSSSFEPPVVIDPLSNASDNIADGFASDDNNEDDHHSPLPSQSLSSLLRYLNDGEVPISSKDRLIHLLKLNLVRHGENQNRHINNRRYAPQSFHALRG